MRFDPRLTGGAAILAQTHQAMLERLPATFHASVLVELQKWGTLFLPERAYQRALLQHLARLTDAERLRAFAGIQRIETEAGCASIRITDPARFQDEAQVVLRKRRLLPQWRQEIADLFQSVDPAIDAQLHPPDAPRRLVVQLYGSGIAIQSDALWSRFRGTGLRIPLDLRDATRPEAFLRALFTGRARDDEAGPATTLFSAAAAAGFAGPDAWVVECGEALYALCGASGGASGAAGAEASRDPGRRAPSEAVTGLSYERLRGYRDALTRALYAKVQSGVASPQEFAAYARSLTIAPDPGVLLYSADVMQAFVRDVLLTGNGTLFVNNTFVEWAAVQALKRAQPRILVTRYGVRDKMKPFSSLLLFSQPRASDQIPMIEDPVGSFVDVEQLSYYVWLNAEKSPAYRTRTLYLFLAEGVDEMLAIRSGATQPGTTQSSATHSPATPTPATSTPATSTPASLPAATLADVYATMAAWLGVTVPASSGRVIDRLVS